MALIAFVVGIYSNEQKYTFYSGGGGVDGCTIIYRVTFFDWLYVCVALDTLDSLFTFHITMIMSRCIQTTAAQ